MQMERERKEGEAGAGVEWMMGAGFDVCFLGEAFFIDF